MTGYSLFKLAAIQAAPVYFVKHPQTRLAGLSRKQASGERRLRHSARHGFPVTHFLPRAQGSADSPGRPQRNTLQTLLRSQALQPTNCAKLPSKGTWMLSSAWLNGTPKRGALCIAHFCSSQVTGASLGAIASSSPLTGNEPFGVKATARASLFTSAPMGGSAGSTAGSTTWCFPVTY